LGACGCGAVAGGFLRLSNNCCKPAAPLVPAVSIMTRKQRYFISWAPTQFDNSYRRHLPRLPNGIQLVQNTQAVQVDKSVEYKPVVEQLQADELLHTQSNRLQQLVLPNHNQDDNSSVRRRDANSQHVRLWQTVCSWPPNRQISLQLLVSVSFDFSYMLFNITTPFELIKLTS
jgi:hypothetical protein